jgi:hypothetical protein
MKFLVPENAENFLYGLAIVSSQEGHSLMESVAHTIKES